MDIDKENLILLYKIEKSWPEMWKWVQIQANKNHTLDDVLCVLKRYWMQREHIDNAWAYCTIALQKRTRRAEETKREYAWEQKKEEEKSFVEKLAGLIKGIGKEG